VIAVLNGFHVVTTGVLVEVGSTEFVGDAKVVEGLVVLVSFVLRSLTIVVLYVLVFVDG